MAVLLLSVLCFAASTVLADLPSHCLKWHVLGTWDFKVSAAGPDSPLCGHTRPDDIVTPYVKALGYSNPGFSVVASGNFSLLSNATNEAILCIKTDCESAHWTMVYDEAIAIRGLSSGLELLLPLYFEPRIAQPGRQYPDPKQASHWQSFCDRTYPGWYGLGRDKRGCVVAKNRVERAAQPSVALMSDNEATLLQTGLKTQLKMALETSFLAEHLDSRALNFKQLEEEVSLINKRQKMWVADADSAAFAKDFSNRDWLSSVGGDREKLQKPKSYSLDNIVDPKERAREEKRRSCIRQVLPSSWDWSTNALTRTPVINQGSCGSCYAVSSADAFTSRIRLKKQDNTVPARSADAIVRCSPTNQACDGGFPWLVAHHGHYEGLYSQECVGPYSSSPPHPNSALGRCQFNSNTCRNSREFVKSWGYVGGYYGRGNAEDMMWSLFRDGPMVVAINAQSDLFVYSSGLFMAEDPTPSDTSKTRDSYWRSTTHAVALVGYGELNVGGSPVATWKLKNSWGSSWGEQGYFNIQRGVDAMAVESMAVHAIFGDGKPGNLNFEKHIKQRLVEIDDPGCTDLITDMLRKELV